MTQTRLEQTRQAYLAECEHDRKVKAKQTEIVKTQARIKELSIKMLNNLDSIVNNHQGYHHVDTSMELAEEFLKINKYREELASAEDAVRNHGLFTLEEQRAYIDKASKLKNSLDNLELKLDKQAKREGIEIFL